MNGEPTISTLVVRLLLAMTFGGMIGMERGRKRRPAGFRTYMLVCLGAALAMLLGEYLYAYAIFSFQGHAPADFLPDVARMGSLVINGVGFLGAGTILVTRHSEVKGLTTAAGLWASACTGIAIGAGFYRCAALAFVIIMLSMSLLPLVESRIVEKSAAMNIYVEMSSLDAVSGLLDTIRSLDIRVLEIDIGRGTPDSLENPSAVITMHLRRKMTHTGVLASLSDVAGVTGIDEI